MIGQNTDLVHEIAVKVDGEPLDVSKVDLVEFSFDEMKKMYPSADVNFEGGSFFVHLTQEETQEFGDNVTVQIRVKFMNGNVVLSNRRTVPVNEALSKEII